MDSTRTIVSSIGYPSFIYKYDSFVKLVQETPKPLPSIPWDKSQLNPKNRINTLSNSCKWRIDGATMCGTRFFAIPTSILPDLLPLRIDVYIPDQSFHPSQLREILESSRSVTLRHGNTIANLGISRHLCRALDSYCERHPEFLENYVTAPFGSRIVVESVEADVEKMEIYIDPAHSLEAQSSSIDTLRRCYQDSIPAQNWPNTIDITSLRLIKQLHDSISVVQIAGSGEELVFKSNTGDFVYLYHELRNLLMTTPHPNIISRPLNIITKRSNFGGKQGIVGFTLPYYPLGSIRDVLPLRPATTRFTQNIKWAHQITSSLLHIVNSSQTFYSDLRPDNVLLSPTQDLVLCDFEQRGNWHEWLPPEILYRQYVENLRSNRPFRTYSDRWAHLIEAYSTPHFKNDSQKAPAQVVNRLWFSLSPEAQEKAMVYSLGMFLYCLFEGLSNVRVNIANAFPCEPDVEFPEFKNTPPVVQGIIKRCTIDAPQWKLAETSGHARRVIRVRDRLFPEGLMGFTGNLAHVTGLVLDTGLEWWHSELTKAEEFLDGENWQSGLFGSERPTLQEVSDMIEDIKTGKTV